MRSTRPLFNRSSLFPLKFRSTQPTAHTTRNPSECKEKHLRDTATATNYNIMASVIMQENPWLAFTYSFLAISTSIEAERNYNRCMASSVLSQSSYNRPR
jgi:hypothetical protein